MTEKQIDAAVAIRVLKWTLTSVSIFTVRKSFAFQTIRRQTYF